MKVLNCVIIDNCIVSKYENGNSITPIKMLKKMNSKLEIDSLPKITLGSRKKDNLLITRLCDSLIGFDDLFNVIND